MQYKLTFLAPLAALVLSIQSNCLSAPPEGADPIKQFVEETKSYLDSKLRGPREMEVEKLGVINTYPGWENFPLTHWRYKKPGGKVAEVLMLNPSNEQIARWVVTTCLELKGSLLREHYMKLCDHIIGQSGGQFPVAGIVYEDMGGGPFKIWGFRNGVTVGFKDIQNGEDRPVTPEEIKASLDPLTPLRYSGQKARIQSTTRKEYKDFGGKENVEGEAFLEVNRRLYQEAWGKDRNLMMLAWAKAHLGNE